jgi:hypothetical protein
VGVWIRSAQGLAQNVEVGGQLRTVNLMLSRGRVFNAKYMGMQGLSAKTRQRRPRGLGEEGRLGAEPGAVDVIAEEGVAD